MFKGKVKKESLGLLEELRIPHDKGWVQGSFIKPNLIVGPLINVDEDYFSNEWWIEVDPGTVISIDSIPDKSKGISTFGVNLINQERERQIRIKGYGFSQDQVFKNGELGLAAACYAIPHYYRPVGEPLMYWPFSKDSWSPTPEKRVLELQKAGALIAAEIDRLIFDNNTIFSPRQISK